MLDEQQQEPSHSKNALYSLSLAERVIFNFKLNFSSFWVFIQLILAPEGLKLIVTKKYHF